MAASNLYQELKDVLQDFKTFLDENVTKIKPAIQTLKQAIPQISELLDKLIDLMNKLKTEIEKLDPGSIPTIGELSSFTTKITAFLNSAKSLLPNEAATIDDVLSVANVVSGLPSLGDIKAEILTLIDDITGKLQELKSA
jgi:type VII secretion effector (TIGR04197 family)